WPQMNSDAHGSIEDHGPRRITYPRASVFICGHFHLPGKSNCWAEWCPKIPGMTSSQQARTGDSLSKMSKTPRRSALTAVPCRHCLQGSSYFQYGAKKYQIWSLTREAPQGAIGVSPAESAGSRQKNSRLQQPQSLQLGCHFHRHVRGVAVGKVGRRALGL